MKSPFIVLLSILFLTACMPPSSEDHYEDDNENPSQGYMNSELPGDYYGRQDQSQYVKEVTDLRSPPSANRPGNGKVFPDYRFSYDLLDPEHVLYLPEELFSITGLSMSPNGEFLVASNYKDGEIHYIDTWSGLQVREVWFKSRSNYKAIETVRNDIYVVKDNGTLVRVTKLQNKKPKTKVVSSDLSAKYNVQGMTYDPWHHELLMICQGNGGDGIFNESKNIFKYDLEEKELFKTPLFRILDEDLKAYMDYLNPKEEGEELFHTEKDEYPSFEPTALAIHPETAELYVLSGSSMQLAVLSDDGNLLHIEKLDPALFNDPEGMCFDKYGTLYISSKGDKRYRGQILSFEEIYTRSRSRQPS